MEPIIFIQRNKKRKARRIKMDIHLQYIQRDGLVIPRLLAEISPFFRTSKVGTPWLADENRTQQQKTGGKCRTYTCQPCVTRVLEGGKGLVPPKYMVISLGFWHGFSSGRSSNSSATSVLISSNSSSTSLSKSGPLPVLNNSKGEATRSRLVFLASR